MGIAIGYFAYNYDNVPLRVSSALTPILGADNLDGFTAKIIDILAVFATIGGVATSLGFIGSQFITGLDYQWGIRMGNLGVLLVVTVMTLLFTTTMVLGVDKGDPPTVELQHDPVRGLSWWRRSSSARRCS